ncbi:hypothetical protein Salat_1137200 [Sesamum alatum]|uniref:Retrotransposon gag domain-containing protein n=1 Tax=Sesamum alatum TaxID=300844 RepID=A0AAE2CN78_9LAMI|nr:hypothetical protein Salat_1137200 [Sesamum alatum]
MWAEDRDTKKAKKRKATRDLMGITSQRKGLVSFCDEEKSRRTTRKTRRHRDKEMTYVFLKGSPFRTTLVGRAQTWFSQLAQGSIETFKQLAQSFVHHFAGNIRHPKTPGHLFTIIQEEGESLRSYMQRIRGEILDVPNISLELLSSIIAQGLKNGGLADSLIGEPASSWEELLVRAERFILI